MIGLCHCRKPIVCRRIAVYGYSVVCYPFVDFTVSSDDEIETGVNEVVDDEHVDNGVNESGRMKKRRLLAVRNAMHNREIDPSFSKFDVPTKRRRVRRQPKKDEVQQRRVMKSLIRLPRCSETSSE